MGRGPLLSLALALFLLLAGCGTREASPPPAVLEGAEQVRLVLARSVGEPSPQEALLLCDAKAPFQAVFEPGWCLPVPQGLSLGARPVLGGLLEVGVFLRLAATGEGWHLRYRLYPARGAGDFAALVLAPGDSSRLPEGPLYLGGLPRGRPSFRHPLLLAPCSLPTPQGCQGVRLPSLPPPRGAVADLSAPYPPLPPPGYHLGPLRRPEAVPEGPGVEVRLSDGRRLYTEGAGRPLLLGGGWWSGPSPGSCGPGSSGWRAGRPGARPWSSPGAGGRPSPSGEGPGPPRRGAPRPPPRAVPGPGGEPPGPGRGEGGGGGGELRGLPPPSGGGGAAPPSTRPTRASPLRPHRPGGGQAGEVRPPHRDRVSLTTRRPSESSTRKLLRGAGPRWRRRSPRPRRTG